MMPTFNTISELRELIKYYLDNADERQDIAEKCKEICVRSFKYTDSAKIIFDVIHNNSL